MTRVSASVAHPVISISGLSASYGERRVLHGVDLEMYRGEIFVLLGGSGSGKTTLLRQVLALARPDAGRIIVNGTDVTSCSAAELAAVRRRIGVAFQGSALFNSMTIAENVALPLQELTRLADPIIALMVWMKLKAVGLAKEADFFPHQLSGGMKKRAAIARAMALDPDILVFDEPSAGLDPIVAAGLDELILFLKRAFGMTMLVVTHAMESAVAHWRPDRAAARGEAGGGRHPRGIPCDGSSASTPVSRTKARPCAARDGRRFRGGVPATDSS